MSHCPYCEHTRRFHEEPVECSGCPACAEKDAEIAELRGAILGPGGWEERCKKAEASITTLTAEIERYRLPRECSTCSAVQHGGKVLCAECAEALTAERDKWQNEVCTAKDHLPVDLEEDSLGVGITKLRDTIKSLQDKLDLAERERLWLEHGHTSMYGDDGEMQCSECVPFGAVDYKREPIEWLRSIAYHARLAVRKRENDERDTLRSKLDEAQADIQVLSIAFQRALNDLSRATGTTERSAILERMVVKRNLIVEGT